MSINDSTSVELKMNMYVSVLNSGPRLENLNFIVNCELSIDNLLQVMSGINPDDHWGDKAK